MNNLENSEKKNAYGLEEAEHELAQKYRPKFLARGGEHIIYELPEHPDIVAKVSRELSKRIVIWNAEHGLPIDSLPEKIEAYIQGYIKREAKRFGQLKESFGKDHVLGQRKIMLKLPITEDILEAMFDGKPPATGNEIWSVVMLQERAVELEDSERLNLVGGYAEQGEISSEKWNKVTDHLVFDKNRKTLLGEGDFLAVQSNNHLEALLKRAGDDKDLRESLTELIERAISYTEESGEILDLIGADNVVFSRKNGKWTYRLVDALYPSDEKMIDKTTAIIARLSTGMEVNDGERNTLMNTLNYIRTVNGLAEQLGIPRRIEITSEEVKVGSGEIQKVIREYLERFPFYKD